MEFTDEQKEEVMNTIMNMDREEMAETIFELWIKGTNPMTEEELNDIIGGEE